MTQGSFGSLVTPVTWDLMILKANQNIHLFVGGWGEIQAWKNWSHISFMNIWWRVLELVSKTYVWRKKLWRWNFWWLKSAKKQNRGKEKHLQHQRHSKNEHDTMIPTRWTRFLFEFTFGAKKRDPWPSPFLFGLGGWGRVIKKKSTESTSPRRSMGLEYLPIYIYHTILAKM